MNTLRRICMSDIPIYSFDTVEFGKNTSIFNNDYMRHRIRSIPIRSIENDNTFFEEEEFDDNIDSENNDYTTENILLNENAEIAMGNDNIGLNDEIKTEVKNTYDQVNMHISVENKNDEVRIVTTDDAKFYKQPFKWVKMNNGVNKQKKNCDLFPVKSAFNGLAIYKVKSVLNSSYKIATCEHIGLHVDMIKNGKDKLYINPFFTGYSGYQGQIGSGLRSITSIFS